MKISAAFACEIASFGSKGQIAAMKRAHCSGRKPHPAAASDPPSNSSATVAVAPLIRGEALQSESPRPQEQEAMLDILETSALAAGQAILEIYRAGPAVTYKADASPVTDADHRAEQIILADLAAAFPIYRSSRRRRSPQATLPISPERVSSSSTRWTARRNSSSATAISPSISAS